MVVVVRVRRASGGELQINLIEFFLTCPVPRVVVRNLTRTRLSLEQLAGPARCKPSPRVGSFLPPGPQPRTQAHRLTRPIILVNLLRHHRVPAQVFNTSTPAKDSSRPESKWEIFLQQVLSHITSHSVYYALILHRYHRLLRAPWITYLTIRST